MLYMIIILCLISGFYSKNSPITDSANVVQSVLLSPETVMQKVIAFAGFGDIPGYAKINVGVPELATYTDYRGPMLMDRINGHPTYQIWFKNIPIKSGKRIVARDWRILIDAVSGEFLDAYSVCDSVGSSDTLPEPIGDSLERCKGCQALASGFPPYNMKQALDAVGHSISAAKVIRVSYLNCPDIGPNAIPQVWLITTRGEERPFPVSRPSGTPQPEPRFLNAMEYVVDATNNILLYFARPPYKEGKKP
jgi:hypothetical protein